MKSPNERSIETRVAIGASFLLIGIAVQLIGLLTQSVPTVIIGGLVWGCAIADLRATMAQLTSGGDQ